MQLPDKPSELIELALADLAKCERSPKYEIDMDEWHVPDNGTCHVCLAGSVMAKSMNMPSFARVKAHHVPGSDREKLMALDAFRNGDTDDALDYLSITRPASLPKTFYVTPYNKNKTQFKRDMRKLIKLLREHSL